MTETTKDILARLSHLCSGQGEVAMAIALSSAVVTAEAIGFLDVANELEVALEAYRPNRHHNS